MEYILVLCTIDDFGKAGNIAKCLLNKKLIACANVVPNLTSLYLWEGNIAEDNEYLMILKSRRELFDEIKQEILKLHPYEVPEIISIKLDEGNPKYLNWIKACTINN